MNNSMLCSECKNKIQLYMNPMEGDITECPCCGAEFIYNHGIWVLFEFEGEDWGE